MEAELVERFKPIPGYEELYEVSNFGRVRSLATDKILKPGIDRYCKVNLCVNGTRKNFLVHRLVATCFIPNIDNHPQVNHIDNDRTNNHATNLEWGTQKMNIEHASRQNRMKGCTDKNKKPRGETHGNSVLTDEKVRLIKSMFGTHSIAEIARIFNTVPSTIGFIKRGQTWKHVI